MAEWARKFVTGSFRAVLVAVVLGIGVLSMVALSNMKAPPEQTRVSESRLRVETIRAIAQDVPVSITGLGEAKALNEVAISPEVSGNVVEIHPRLEQGETVAKDALLFRVNPLDYRAAEAQAAAQTAQLATAVERLKKQYEIDRSRLETLRRSEELAARELARARTLLQEDEVGTQSGVDATEVAFNRARDAYDLLNQQVTIYPSRIIEAESALAAASAQHDIAAANLARTEVRAPFAARVKNVQLEQNQYVRAGTPVLTLSDDSLLEILVPVDSRDAQRWLRFDDANEDELAWFEALEPVDVKVTWVEDPGQHPWHGTLSRVTNFDTRNRTVTLAVWVEGKDARRSGDEGLPLVPGMFCAVEIPGRVMRQVFKLPLWAVNARDEAFIAREGRLSIQPVAVLRRDGNSVYVSEGIQAGDSVIVTRLVDPTPNSLLDIVDAAGENGS